MKKKLLFIMMVFLMTPNCVDAQGFLNKIGKALDKAAEVIDKLPSESSSKGSSSPSNNSSSTSSRTYTTKQGGMTISTIHSDLKIKITRCEAAGNTVVIDLVVENIGSSDSDLSIYGGYNERSAAYDDEGNVYKKETLKVKLGNSGLSEYGASQNLPSEVPIKGRIQIERVPESATVISRIDLRIDSDTWGFSSKYTKLSNIPITREGDE